jgi:lipid-binding SYLF domain-containing protein
MIRSLTLAALLVVASGAEASTTRKVARRVRIATQVLIDVMSSSRSVPPVVYENARCIASLRSVKAGLIFGGEGSVGLVSCRVGDDWSLPSFLNIGGPNFGLQIGVSVSEVVLVFVTDAARDILLRPSVQLGVDAGFALGPIGSGVGAGWTPEAPVLAYVKNQGFWAGIKLDALVLSHGVVGNADAYGHGVRPEHILSTPVTTSVPEMVTRYPSMLRYYDRR